MMIKKKIITIKNLLNSTSFQYRHTVHNCDFTRKRKLTFIVVVLLILKKSLKSIQLMLNELFKDIGNILDTVTASAFVQARLKLLHTAYIELNEKGIIEPYYEDDKYKKFKGFRVLAVDGSKIILPKTKEIISEYGSINITNQFDNYKGESAQGIAEVLYDLYNNIAIDGVLGHAKAYEVDLAMELLSSYKKKNDLLIFDRGYPSYKFLAYLKQNKINFVGRCSKASFKEARKMFIKKYIIDSTVVKLSPTRNKVKEEIKKLGLPKEIKVRFVRVILPNGEIEVLVTSLLDQKLYSDEEFKELYNLRWGIETYYGKLKGRLNLENFTGKSVEAVRQDFFATLFISNLESILTEDVDKELNKKSSNNKHSQKVNKNVSFNIIKNYVIELFYKNEDTEALIKKLSRIFKKNPNCVREERKVPRKESNIRARINFFNYKKKICF